MAAIRSTKKRSQRRKARDASADPESRVPERATAFQLTSGTESVQYGCFSIALGALAGGLGMAGAVALLGSKSMAPLFIGIAAFAGVTFWQWRARVGARVVVGEDGFTLRGRFVAYADVVGAEQKWSIVGAQLIRIFLRDRSTVTIRLDTLGAEGARELDLRLSRAAARYFASSDAQRLSVLDRGDRTVADWRDALGRLWSTATYRSPPIALERVRETLANAAAPDERRVGAAIALMASGARGAKQMIFHHADACARPELAEALASIAHGEEDDGVLERVFVQKEPREKRAAGGR